MPFFQYFLNIPVSQTVELGASNASAVIKCYFNYLYAIILFMTILNRIVLILVCLLSNFMCFCHLVSFNVSTLCAVYANP